MSQHERPYCRCSKIDEETQDTHRYYRKGHLKKTLPFGVTFTRVIDPDRKSIQRISTKTGESKQTVLVVHITADEQGR